MGSRGMFDSDLCFRCDRFVIEPEYPDIPNFCSKCEVRCRCPFVAKILRHVLRREPESELVATVAGFCATYRTTRRRLFFFFAQCAAESQLVFPTVYLFHWGPQRERL